MYIFLAKLFNIFDKHLMDNQWVDNGEEFLSQLENYKFNWNFGKKTLKHYREFTRLVLPHIALVLFIVAYCLLGAYVFFLLEQPTESDRKDIGRQYLLTNISEFIVFVERLSVPKCDWNNQHLTTLNEKTVDLLKSYQHLSGKYLINIDDLDNRHQHWSYASSILFSFTVITTIGYGNLAPVTFYGRLFCILYGLIGIPATMVAIANVGQFLAEGIELIFKKLKRKIKSFIRGKSKDKRINVKKSPRDDNDTESEEPKSIFSAVTVIMAFIGYILIGAMCLPVWENFDFFGGCYFAFVTITTVGLGDIVPEKLDFLFPTIVYITLGLAITTLTIEVMSQYLRQVHYVGSEVKGSKDVYVWFGNRMLTVGDLVGAIGDQYGIPKGEINDLKHKMDTVVTNKVAEKEAKKKALASRSHSKVECRKISRAPLFDDIEFRYIDEESLAELPATSM